MTLKLNLSLDGFMTLVSRYDHFSKNAWATLYGCFSDEGWEALYKHLFATNIAGEIIDINKEIGKFDEVDTEGLLDRYLEDFPNLKEMSREEIKNSIKGVVFVDDGESDDFLGTWLVPAKHSIFF